MAKEKAEEVGVALVRFVAQHIATTHCTKATIISYVGQENHVVFFSLCFQVTKISSCFCVSPGAICLFLGDEPHAG